MVVKTDHVSGQGVHPIAPAEVAMLVRGGEAYGIGAIVKLYARAWPEATFVCVGDGPLYEWLSQNVPHLELVEGLASFRAANSLVAITSMPSAFRRARQDAIEVHQRIKDRGIRVIHTQRLAQQIVAGCMRPMGYASVWQINNNMQTRRLLGVGRTLNHRLARWGADLLLPASDYIAANWTGCGVPIKTVRNSAEPLDSTCASAPAAPPPMRCLIAGRLEASKGHHVALEAVLAARSAGCEVTLDIFGGPLDQNDYATSLRTTITAAHAEDVVHLRGFCGDLRRQHANYHLGLQCRIDPEPCSLWVCETMLDGLPLIASATGGTPELVADGKSGILVPPNDPVALGDAIIKLCRSPDLLAALRDAALVRGREHFSRDRMMRETLVAYQLLQN